MMVKSSCMLSDNNPMIVNDSDTTIQMGYLQHACNLQRLVSVQVVVDLKRYDRDHLDPPFAVPSILVLALRHGMPCHVVYVRMAAREVLGQLVHVFPRFQGLSEIALATITMTDAHQQHVPTRQLPVAYR